MLYSIMGIALCLIPFVLIRLYKNKLKGFLTVFSTVSIVHIATAVSTQYIGIFSYVNVLIVHSVVAFITIFILYKYRYFKNVFPSDPSPEYVFSQSILQSVVRKTKKIFQNWFLLVVLCIALFLMYSIRFNYSGPVDTTFGLYTVENSSYTYPQYSDEWVGSSLVQYSIREKTLPLVNPLYKNQPFINFLAISHTLFAEVIVVTGLNPLTQYTYLASLNGVLLMVGIYIVLRLLSVRPSFASITALSVLLITNSGNLPSIWYILPYTISLTYLVFSIAGLLLKSKYIYLINICIAVLLYPPNIIFAFAIVISGLCVNFSTKKDTIKQIRFSILSALSVFLVVFGVIAIVGLQNFSVFELYDRAVSFIIRESLDTGKVTYRIWNIVPVFLLPCSIVGLVYSYLYKKWYIAFPITVGMFLWFIYGYTRTIFLMEPSRIVVITSVLFVLCGGLGMEYLYQKLIIRFDVYSEKYFVFVSKFAILIFILLWVIFLPRLGLWHKLPMVVSEQYTEKVLIPAPPITRYITEDDIRLFSKYKEKIFISHPWKGLVIGSATHNFPLDSKPSTLTNAFLRYQDFMKADCQSKQYMAKKYTLDLVYSTKFDCENFFEVGRSSEGLILYEFNNFMII